MEGMTKEDAVNIFGTRKVLYRCSKISRQTWHNCSDPLSERHTLLVIGGAIYNGYYVPMDWVSESLLLSNNY